MAKYIGNFSHAVERSWKKIEDINLGFKDGSIITKQWRIGMDAERMLATAVKNHTDRSVNDPHAQALIKMPVANLAKYYFQHDEKALEGPALKVPFLTAALMTINQTDYPLDYAELTEMRQEAISEKQALKI